MSIPFNEVDHVGCDLLDLENAELEVAHGVATLYICDYKFHFGKIPKAPDWEGMSLEFLGKRPKELTLDNPFKLKGHLYTRKEEDRFAIMFVNSDNTFDPITVRVGKIPNK